MGLDAYGKMLEKAGLILDAMLNNVITTGVDLYFPEVLDFGPVQDPSGNMFLGCHISIRVQEFVH
jgi:hypothetical protein